MGKAAIKWTDQLCLWESCSAISTSASAQQWWQGRGRSKPALLFPLSHALLPAALQNPLQLSEKRSETCMQCTGGADQHREQAQRHQDALQGAGPSLLLLSPRQLHPLPTALLPASCTAPSTPLLWARTHIVLYLQVSLQASDAARQRLLAGSEAPRASVHTYGDTYHCRQRQRLLLPSAARPRCGEMH